MSGKTTVQSKKNWFVYIIHCSDDSYYTGITTDVDRRFAEHKNKKGAKYFYGRKPEKVVFIESEHDRSSALKREAEIKKQSRTEKLLLVKQFK
ncbi:MAG: GIY-YIG nuclease family protein [gamma proteobacterium symbiont of Taylorina sp.]|nr:GIY-YIG nuclease family protein [gamma proteobacterium symbiont of Taylorina sp.]